MNNKIFKVTHNFDSQEIAKFESIAHDWWNVENKFLSLHRINPLRLNYIAERCNGIFGKKILDIGCGGGILAESMACEGAIVTGLDISLELLQVARLHAIETKIKVDYIHETVEEHTVKNMQRYDVITCMEMLEHVPNPLSIVRLCAQMVKPGGQVFFSTINRNIRAWLIAILGAEYIFRIVPRGMHNIKKFIKPSELLSWIDKTILKESHIIGLKYNILTNKFKLSSDIDVNYILHTIATNY